MKTGQTDLQTGADAVPGAWPLAQNARDKRGFILAQWAVLTVAFLVLGGFIANTLREERAQLLSSARDRLSLGAKSIAFHVERRLTSIDQALLDLRKNLPYLKKDSDGDTHVSMHLRFFQEAVDGVRAATVVDARGVVVASSRPEIVGRNLGQRASFQEVRRQPDAQTLAQTLYFPPPVEGEAADDALNVFRVIVDTKGKFSGIVSATLDPEDFKPILASLHYTPDVSTGLVHASGKALLYLSSPEVVPGTDFSDPFTFVSRHLQSGAEHSLLSGFCHVLPNERLAAVHTINPASPAMSAPLVVIVSQELASILAPWRVDVRNQSILFVLLAAFASLGLFVHQRRQGRVAALTREYQAARQHDIDRLRLATETSGTGIWEFDVKQQTLTWDDTLFRLYGKTRTHGASTYALWRASVLPEDLPAAEAAVQKAIDQVQKLEMIFRIRRDDGEVRVMDALAWVYCDHTGDPVRLIGVNRDITTQQRVAQSLRESKDFIVDVLDSLVEHVAVLDQQGRVVTVNRAWANFSAENGGSRTAVELVGWNYLDVCLESLSRGSCAEASQVATGIQAVLDGTRDSFSLEYACHSPSEKRWFTMHATPLHGAQRGAVIAHENITDRKLAEDARQGAQRVTQQFLDHLPGMAYVKDEKLRVLMANQQFRPMLGVDPATMIGKSNEELFPGDLGERMEADDRRILDTGQGTVILEQFAGRHFESSKFVIENEKGKRLLGGITLDVTRRHKHSERQEALLRISELGGTLPEEEYLRRGLEIAEQLTGSEIGFIHFVADDQQSVELAAWTADTVKACSAASEGHCPIAEAGVWADSARNKAISIFNDYPNHGARKGLPDGHPPLHRLISVPVIEENKVRIVLGLGNKATDYDDFDCASVQLIGNDLWRIVRRARAETALQQKLEELIVLNARLDETNNKLLQSEKLASIGQLAAGVAHEINNPIGYVSSNLNALAGYVNDLLAIDAIYGEAEARFGVSMPTAFKRVQQLKVEVDYDFIVRDIHHLLDESREGLERVRKIVQDLKDFSRVGGTGWQWIDLHQGLESTLNIVWNEIKYKAEIDREYGDLPEIRCIPSQINQVFMNLLTNAAQSIEAHGRIVLRSGCDESTVWVEVQDNGCGIAAENTAHIFEPFYTTKAVGKGTGLGLSLSWGIVQRHEGRIEVRSALGQGTTFRVTLPIDPENGTEPHAETGA